MPYSDHLVDEIFEIRAKVGSDLARVLYFFVIGKKIVLTNGFIKKTQKTPKNEIESAKKYRNDFLNEQLKDKELKKEYDALEAEFSIIQAILDAGKASGLTQKDLAERSGIAQADISKIETGNANPSLKTLQRLPTEWE